MQKRKIAAPYLFTGKQFLKNAILTSDEKGNILELRTAEKGLKEQAGLEYYNGILTPGFINAHCHLELSHMKGGIEEGKEMDNFIWSVINYRSAGEEKIRQAIEAGDKEMQDEGIVAVGDISNTDHSFSCKKNSPLHYHTFIEIFNMVNADAEETWKKGRTLHTKALKEYGLSAGIVPHASYTVSEDLFAIIREKLNNPENRLSIHNQETLFEEEFIRHRKGRFLTLFEKLGLEKGDSRARNMSSLEYLVRSLPDRPPLLLIHNVHTAEADIHESGLDLSRCHFCLCPNSNLYISGILPSSWLMEEHPEQVCLGTDSLASNHRLSVLEELKTLTLNFPHVPTDRLLSFATLNGAKALGLENRLGSIEKGKNPGINLLENVNLGEVRLSSETSVKPLVKVSCSHT
jgi:cytosine/adenosine deaminase-related metal-dependent hydrolase